MPFPLLNLTMGQKCENWPRFIVSSKQAGVLLLSSLQHCILTYSVIYRVANFPSQKFRTLQSLLITLPFLFLFPSFLPTPPPRSGPDVFYWGPRLCSGRNATVIILGNSQTRSSATAKSTARPSCLVGLLYDIYRETNNCSSTANQPLVRNWPWNLPNSAKECKIMAITTFKVVQGHRFLNQWKAHIRFPISH